ncbi:MAG: ribbon-helix-helix domain-containing protein [Alphaproteobacteria bacterium]|nr:ribbon-helix-helix domain-containing protein [Alphaproteobacteria bacterium]
MAEGFQHTHTENNPHQNTGNKKTPLQGALISKNVRIHDRRTSVRLEPEMWQALREVSEIEGCSIHDLCGAVHDLKEAGASFTAALRVFLMEYYRTAARTSQQVTSVQRQLKAALRPVENAIPHKITA